ncbi:unnamed protein product [Sphagnum balticum]
MKFMETEASSMAPHVRPKFHEKQNGKEKFLKDGQLLSDATYKLKNSVKVIREAEGISNDVQIELVSHTERLNKDKEKGVPPLLRQVAEHPPAITLQWNKQQRSAYTTGGGLRRLSLHYRLGAWRAVRRDVADYRRLLDLPKEAELLHIAAEHHQQSGVGTISTFPQSGPSDKTKHRLPGRLLRQAIHQPQLPPTVTIRDNHFQLSTNKAIVTLLLLADLQPSTFLLAAWVWLSRRFLSLISARKLSICNTENDSER